MSHCKHSLRLAVVLVAVLALSVPAVPAQALGPTDSDGLHTTSWLDFSFSAWFGDLLERWFGVDAERPGATETADDGPSGIHDRSGSTFEPDG